MALTLTAAAADIPADSADVTHRRIVVPDGYRGSHLRPLEEPER